MKTNEPGTADSATDRIYFAKGDITRAEFGHFPSFGCELQILFDGELKVAQMPPNARVSGDGSDDAHRTLCPTAACATLSRRCQSPLITRAFNDRESAGSFVECY